jgi:hypothetical protein
MEAIPPVGLPRPDPCPEGEGTIMRKAWAQGNSDRPLNPDGRITRCMQRVMRHISQA